MKNRLSLFAVLMLLTQNVFAQEVTPTVPAAPKPAEQSPPATEPAPTAPLITTPETKPTPTTQPVTPVANPTTSSATEVDPETQRLIEEAKQKILREKAEKEAAKKREAEEAEQKKQAEVTILGKIWTNSNIYAGAFGGLGISLNNVHGTGYNLGGYAEYRLFMHYSFLFALETGQFSAKTFKFTSTNVTLTPQAGSEIVFGYTAITPMLQYSLPLPLPVEINAAFGLMFSQLKGGSFVFNSTVAPVIQLSAFYPIVSRLDIGTAFSMVLHSANTVEASGTSYALDNKESLTRMNFQAVVRFRVL